VLIGSIVSDRSRALIDVMTFALGLAQIWAYPRLATRYKLAKRALVTARSRYAEGEAPAWRVCVRLRARVLCRVLFRRYIDGWTRAPISSIPREWMTSILPPILDLRS
jgi:hypothetical protein